VVVRDYAVSPRIPQSWFGSSIMKSPIKDPRTELHAHAFQISFRFLYCFELTPSTSPGQSKREELSIRKFRLTELFNLTCEVIVFSTVSLVYFKVHSSDSDQVPVTSAPYSRGGVGATHRLNKYLPCLPWSQCENTFRGNGVVTIKSGGRQMQGQPER
jgi:hypothetical protein